MPANHGLLVQRSSFLAKIRRLTRENGALLIFDEVISGFRLGRGGAAAEYGIVPDLATFGKIIGGGLPVGAFGGPRRLMRHLAPEGDVYQAGTLSGNPLAMAAGLTTLRILERERAWERLEELGRLLDEKVGAVFSKLDLDTTLVRMGSIFWLALGSATPPRSAEAIGPGARERYRPLFHGLLERGIFLAPSAFEVGFLGLAHRAEHIEELARSLEETLSDSAGGGKRGSG